MPTFLLQDASKCVQSMECNLESRKSSSHPTSPRYLFAAVLVLTAGACTYALAQGADFRAAAKSIVATIRAHHYRPPALDTEAYHQIEKAVIEIGETAQSADDFFTRVDRVLRSGPDSHLFLRRPAAPPSERNVRPNAQSARADAVTLAWEGEAAVLTVNTMSGDDTNAKIEVAYDQIAARGPRKLIIDLRRNGGGAFAVLPLVGHLITEPMDAGVFVSRLWYKDHDAAPGPTDFPSATPMRWHSVPVFRESMLSRPLTSYRIEPMQPRFSGPVYVLSSASSISAAEIAIDALKTKRRATIIGEKTPGMLLSANGFEITGGFQLVVPIADYYSISGRRIEGTGVTPDIRVPADKAMAVALGQ